MTDDAGFLFEIHTRTRDTRQKMPGSSPDTAERDRKRESEKLRAKERSMKRIIAQAILFRQKGRRESFIGEFDPGSGRTLAACLTHASRTEPVGKFTGRQVEWRTGE